jgi:hypothetical protein
MSEDFKTASFKDMMANEDFVFVMRHTYEVLCNNSSVCFYRILCWIRSIIMRPDQPVGKIIIMVGPGGVGKSSFIEFLNKHFFGAKHSILLPNTEAITKQFNGAAAKAIVAFVDEGGIAADDRAFQVIKQVTTADRRLVEKKFQEPYHTNAPLNIFLSANSINFRLCMYERRFDVISTNPYFHLENHDSRVAASTSRYGAILHDDAKCKTIANCLAFLVTCCVSSDQYDKVKNQPFITKGFVEMRRDGLGAVDLFVLECIETVSNFARSGAYMHPEDDVKVKTTGNWGEFVPYSWIELHFNNFKKTNSVRSRSREVLRERLTKFGYTLTTEGGILWAQIPGRKTVKKHFASVHPVFTEPENLHVHELTSDDGWSKFGFIKPPVVSADEEDERMAMAMAMDGDEDDESDDPFGNDSECSDGESVGSDW